MKPNHNFFLGESAFPEDGGVTLSQRILDCRPGLEPISEHIDEVGVLRKWTASVRMS